MTRELVAERIFTVDQIAKKLNYHRNTVLKWIHTGELVASRIELQYRVKESDLDDFLLRKQLKKPE